MDQQTCDCGRKLAPVREYDVASSFAVRTCRGCGQRWTIVVHPPRRSGRVETRVIEMTPCEKETS